MHGDVPSHGGSGGPLNASERGRNALERGGKPERHTKRVERATQRRLMCLCMGCCLWGARLSTHTHAHSQPHQQNEKAQVGKGGVCGDMYHVIMSPTLPQFVVPCRISLYLPPPHLSLPPRERQWGLSSASLSFMLSVSRRGRHARIHTHMRAQALGALSV